MSVLHIVNKSPHDRNSLATCLRLAKADASLLLIEDGVYAAQSKGAGEAVLREAMGQMRVYALRPDLDARGVAADRVIDGIALVDYDGFVRLTTEHDKVQSWL